MPVSRFLLVYVGGAAFAGFVVALIAIFLTGGFSDGALFAGFAGAFLLFIMPAMAGLAAASFPILEVNRLGIQIEKEMHMFITRMGILLWVVGAGTIFDILKQMKDYGELANEEAQKIEVLVDKRTHNCQRLQELLGINLHLLFGLIF